MHLIIVTIGSAGDVHPFLEIGRAALARGHRVSVCTSPAFEELVTACGLRFLPVGTAKAYEAAMSDPRLWAPRTSLATLWRVVAPTLQPVYDLLVQELSHDLVVVGSLWALSARVLQETHGIAYLSAQVSPSTLLSALAPPEHRGSALLRALPSRLRPRALKLVERVAIDRRLAPELDRFRARLGRKPVVRVMGHWLHSPQGVLALFPPWFAPAQPDWPTPLRFTGFPLFQAQPGASLDDDLREFLDDGPPPVVVTAGSSLLRGTAFFANAAEAIALLGMRGVFLGGDDAAIPPLPPSVRHRRHAPLAPLLARSAAILHHGGVGTTAFALAAGIPQLVMPFAHDQFDNAERVVTLGCGVRLHHGTRPAALAKAIEGLLDARAVRDACQRARRCSEVDSGVPAARCAVDEIEACAARHGITTPSRAAAGRLAAADPSRIATVG